jgi:hypothetical protein
MTLSFLIVGDVFMMITRHCDDFIIFLDILIREWERSVRA